MTAASHSSVAVVLARPLGGEQRAGGADGDVVVGEVAQLGWADLAEPFPQHVMGGSADVAGEASAVAAPAGRDQALLAEGGEGLAYGDRRDTQQLGEVGFTGQLLTRHQQTPFAPFGGARAAARQAHP